MLQALSSTEIFLIAMLIIFAVPYLIWRFCKTDYYAPLVVVQIIAGILLGPGILGAIFPEYYQFVFNPQTIQSLNGIAWWAVMIFVMIAGIELDLIKAWEYKKESSITAGFALGVPLLFGSLAASGIVVYDGWIGINASKWQFILGMGMACAVTALPILILFMEKLNVLRQPMGQRILRYASLDDIAIWSVLAIILLDWNRVGRQVAFLISFAIITMYFRKLMRKISDSDRWFVAFIWLVFCSFAADWSGMHFMVGAFLAGVVMDADWFEQEKLDLLRHHVLLALMPVFFLSTGLKTNWSVGGASVFIVAFILLIASVAGKYIGVSIAGKILNWKKGEASIIAWLLQTKALIMIIFSNILLDKNIITSDTFTALLLMAIGSTMLTIPMVHPKLEKLKSMIMQA